MNVTHSRFFRASRIADADLKRAAPHYSGPTANHRNVTPVNPPWLVTRKPVALRFEIFGLTVKLPQPPPVSWPIANANGT